MNGEPPHIPGTAPHPHPEVSGVVASPDDLYFGPMRSGPDAPKQSGWKVWAIIGICGLVAAVLCFGGVGYALLTAPTGAEEPFVVGPRPSASGYAANTAEAMRALVILEVTGSGKADIHYNVNGVGGSDNGAQLPWTLKLGPFDAFVVVSMMAQAKAGTTSDVVHGKITLGDKVTECHGQGPFAVATCSGASS